MLPSEFHKEPKLPSKIIQFFCKGELLEEIEGDLLEHYQVLRKDYPKWKSDTFYWFHTFHFIRPFALKKFSQNSNILIMYRNYFKFALRSMWRQKASTAFNLLGLVLAFIVCGLIYLHVQQELSYDKFHDRSEDIYRVAWMNKNPQTRTPHPMAQAMVNDLPEVEAAVSLSPIYGPGLTKISIPITLEAKQITFEETNGFFIDTTFFKVFDFNFIEGMEKDAVNVINGVILSESMAKKYFGSERAVGNRLSFGASTDMLEVVGIVEDAPVTSHFHFDFLITYVTLKSMQTNDPWMSWADFGHFNYVKLKAGAIEEAVEAKIPEWIPKYLDWSEDNLAGLADGTDRFDLQPITDIHLKSNIRWELETNSSMTYLIIYGLSGLFILLISIINFVNLSTARSAQRLKEVGVKKAIGARRGELLSQFIFESTLTTYIALGLSLLAINGLESRFNNLVLGNIDTSLIFNTRSILFLILVATITSFIAAIYPSVYLNAQKPGNILKGVKGSKMGGSKVRNTLLGVQLIAAIVMISGSLIINNQINFLKNKDLGFKQDNLLMIEIDNWIDKSEVVKSSFMQLVGVQSVSMISNSPGGQFNQHPLYLKDDPSQRIDVSEVFVDKESFETLGIEILEGRALDRTMAADSAGRSFVLNETAIKELGLEKGVGESIVWIDNENVVEGQIVGVVKDFHYKSLHVPIRPLIMLVRPRNYNYLIANVESNDYPALIKEMEQVYAKLYPEFDFEYKFLDQEIEALYKEESRTLILTSLLSGISIFLSTTGLVGLVIIAIKQRVREIGIRKVLGASISQILLLITNRFLIIGLVSTLIAVPITFILMRNWMSNFTYQNGISPLVFLLTALGLLMLIFITISMISLKTARSNPVLALRYE